MFDVTEGRDTPFVQQLCVFLPNRVGALMLVMRVLEEQDIRVCALSIIDAADHAVARIVVDRPTLALNSLQGSGYHVFETDLLAVRLKSTAGGAVRRMLSALLVAEINVDYVFPLTVSGESRPIFAVHVEEMESAARSLVDQGMELVGQGDLT